MHGLVKDMVGARIGALDVIRREGSDTRRRALWLCRCDCGREFIARGSQLRNGETVTCGCHCIEAHSIRAVPSYEGAHRRVQKHCGSAANYECVDCGRRAVDWSYDGNAPDEMIGPDSRGRSMNLKFSYTPEFYSPRCRPCHKTYDMSWGG